MQFTGQQTAKVRVPDVDHENVHRGNPYPLVDGPKGANTVFGYQFSVKVNYNINMLATWFVAF